MPSDHLPKFGITWHHGMGKKKSAHIFFKKKTGHVTKNSGVCKFFWGTQKIFGDQQNVFGADLRKNGEPKVNLGSGENIFGHLFFFGD